MHQYMTITLFLCVCIKTLISSYTCVHTPVLTSIHARSLHTHIHTLGICKHSQAYICTHQEYPTTYTHTYIRTHTQVFTSIRETDGYKGDVLFLEEDHMPTPDLYVTAKRLLEIKNSGSCEGCWGAYLKFGCMREVCRHSLCR